MIIAMYHWLVWFGLQITLQWRHNGHDGFSNHQTHHCLLNCLFRRRSKNIKAPRHWLCVGNSPVTGEFPHKRPVTRKMFPFDDVIMTGIWKELIWVSIGFFSGSRYLQESSREQLKHVPRSHECCRCVHWLSWSWRHEEIEGSFSDDFAAVLKCYEITFTWLVTLVAFTAKINFKISTTKTPFVSASMCWYLLLDIRHDINCR